MDMQQLPQDIDTEQYLLSGIFLDPECVLELKIRPEHFYRIAHQHIYRSMRALASKNVGIDLLSLKTELEGSNLLKDVGGVSYLVKIVDTHPSINTAHSAGIIVGKYKLRQLVIAANKIKLECYSGTDSASEILSRSQISILDVGEEKSKSTHISDILIRSLDRMSAIKDGQIASGVMSGIPLLDEMTSGLQPSDLIILAGRPSMGKSALAFKIAFNAAMAGEPTLIFSHEMPDIQIVNRYLSAWTKINNAKFKSSNFNNREWESVNEAACGMNDIPLYILDTGGMTIDRIRSASRRYRAKYDIKLIVFDYLQLTRGWDQNGQGPKTDIVKQFKGMAKELDIPALVLSQLNRNLEQRADKVPIMADLRDTGAIEQEADCIMFVYRDIVYNKAADPNSALLVIAKNRNGGIGNIDLNFEGKYTDFTPKYC